MHFDISHGFRVRVDESDWDLVSGHKWCHFKGKYAQTNIRKDGGGWRPLSLHRFLMGEPPGLQVDHINGDGFDNRRSNLRIATHSENQRNGGAWGESKFRGVSRNHAHWTARAVVNGKNRSLGTFATEEEAARAYDDYVVVAYGEFARPNRQAVC